MTTDEVLSEFRAAGALLEGHFILTSGLHSPIYLQKNLVFCDPPRTERLCRAPSHSSSREATAGRGGCARDRKTLRLRGLPLWRGLTLSANVWPLAEGGQNKRLHSAPRHGDRLGHEQER